MGCPPPAGRAGRRSSGERGAAPHTLRGQVRAACSPAASAAPALGRQPASHGVTSAPPPGPSPRRAIPGRGAAEWGQGSRHGKKPRPLGKAGGRATPSAARGLPRAAGRGRRKRAGLERARGYSSPSLSQTRADPSSPVPSQETGTYFISLGQVRPRYHRLPPHRLPFQLPRPPPSWAGPRPRCHPLFGERQLHRRHLGARAGGGGPSQPRERCPTREAHVMKPGEGGQVAPSLPGSGQTCLESQGRTRSSNPPTRSHLTRPAASPLHRARRPPRPPPRPAPPRARPPPRPPHFSFTWLARRRRRRQHTPPGCAQSRSQRPRGHHARPQLKRQRLEAAAPTASAFRGAPTQSKPHAESSEDPSRTVLARRSPADRSAQWPRLAVPWSGSPARSRPPPACPRRPDWSPETYQGKWAPLAPRASTTAPRFAPLLLGAAPGASGGSRPPGSAARAHANSRPLLSPLPAGWISPTCTKCTSRGEE